MEIRNKKTRLMEGNSRVKIQATEKHKYHKKIAFTSHGGGGILRKYASNEKKGN